ncbi:MAG: hypothetical protein KUG77_11570 [Nannocystaceae bacterium]|nr:hypothetical protein [Nannocystaceae bacterium]
MITNEKLRNKLATTGVLTFALGVAGISLGTNDVAAAPAKQLKTEASTAEAAIPVPYYLPVSFWAQNQLLLQPQILPQQQLLILPQQQLTLNQALLQNALYNDLAYQGGPFNASTALPTSNDFVLD